MTNVSRTFIALGMAAMWAGTASATVPQHPSDTRNGPHFVQSAAGKNCRREPIWGFRMSVFCKPTGMCSDRVIKGYRTVCG